MLRLVGVRLMDEVSSTYTREEVAALVEESRGEGLLEDGEYDRLVGRARVHREDGGDRADAARRPSRPCAEDRPARTSRRSAPRPASAGSRWSGDDDELVGYLHIKDVLETDEARRHRPIEDKWIRPFAPVRCDDLLHDTLEKLQRRGAHMARVVDAEGGTLGVATLEDVIEELVGEIRDTAHLEAPDRGGERRARHRPAIRHATVRVCPAV